MDWLSFFSYHIRYWREASVVGMSKTRKDWFFSMCPRDTTGLKSYPSFQRFDSSAGFQYFIRWLPVIEGQLSIIQWRRVPVETGEKQTTMRWLALHASIFHLSFFKVKLVNVWETKEKSSQSASISKQNLLAGKECFPSLGQRMQISFKVQLAWKIISHLMGLLDPSTSPKDDLNGSLKWFFLVQVHPIPLRILLKCFALLGERERNVKIEWITKPRKDTLHAIIPKHRN